ncbi:hypothetical protein HZI73_21360 [Vallitalea pronyensis]|uniref:Butirosin biosynthesis protein H N-terminal domain-containing protein n=1 Tax=Vallitalea pronyensis TaxID=1348613 RepID=A0A8J8MNA6_9FIRM|nr:hypothetical protein [Vallitalea pronyensis]QUI24691.1 hypothetical protein HZI73_21360 [Vallitalea pronyensis]
MIKSANVLPLKYPPITCYEEQANILSILLNDERTLPWIYSNYIHSEVYEHQGQETKVHFYKIPCDWLKIDSVPFSLVEKMGTTLDDFLMKAIDLGYYVRFTIDAFHIPSYEVDFHYPHHIMVHGYDQSKKKYHIADNFKLGKYSYEECTFQDMNNAYLSGVQEKVVIKNPVFNLISLKKDFKYQFDIEFVSNALEAYITSANISLLHMRQNEQHKKNWQYGFAQYRFLQNQIDNLMNNEYFSGIRSFQFLFDHNSMMLDRIAYMGNSGFLKDSETHYKDYTVINKKCMTIRSFIIKYALSPNNKTLVKAKSLLSQIEESERKILQSLIKDLRLQISR